MITQVSKHDTPEDDEEIAPEAIKSEPEPVKAAPAAVRKNNDPYGVTSSSPTVGATVSTTTTQPKKYRRKPRKYNSKLSLNRNAHCSCYCQWRLYCS